jgi:hypothetical protein
VLTRRLFVAVDGLEADLKLVGNQFNIALVVFFGMY